MDQIIKQLKQLQIIITKHPLYGKYHIYLIPGVACLIGVLILLLITIPQGMNLVKNNQSLNELKQKQTDYQAKITTLNKIDIDEYRNDLNDVLYILPSDKDIPSAINSVLDVLSQSGLTLTNFTLGASVPSKSAGESYVVNLEVTGSINQLKTLIETTPKASRLIKIVGININSAAGGSSQTTLDLLVFFAPLDLSIKTSADQKVNLLSEEDQKTLAQIRQNISSIVQITDETINNIPTGKDDPFN